MRGTVTRRAAAGVVAAAVLGAGAVWARRRRPPPEFADVAYGAESPLQRMDIYLPQGEGPFPFVIDIHGGGFRSGDKTDERVPPGILAAGIAVVRVNYRLSGQVHWPGPADDILAAIDFLTMHQADYRLDARRMALWGQSAGGFLAVVAALQLAATGTPPAAVVDWYGPSDFSTMDGDMAALGRTRASGPVDAPDSTESLLLGFAVGARRAEARDMGPMGLLDALPDAAVLPPFLILHGARDNIVSPRQSERLRDAILSRRPQADVQFAILPDGQHGGAAFDTPAVMLQVTRFLRQHLGVVPPS